MNELIKFGWNDFFEAQFEPFKDSGFVPARVAILNRKGCLLYCSSGEISGEIPGKMYHKSGNKNELPSVGDWVAVRLLDGEKKAVVEHVLTRKNKFSRKVAGNVTDEQIVAANIDSVFIVTSLNEELNLRRLERYLTLAWDNEIYPVIVLNKSDLCANPEEVRNEVEMISFNTPVHITSAKNETGLDSLVQYFAGNKTVAVIGSSGVGKSTLINDMMSLNKMKVQDIGNYKAKGKHTTSHRELIVLPNGGLIIDTPGMREIQLWEGGDGLLETFDDIAKLELQCKFTDCKHDSEPGCAVKNALEDGTIDGSRLKSYRKLKNEISYIERKQNIKAKLDEKRKCPPLARPRFSGEEDYE